MSPPRLAVLLLSGLACATLPAQNTRSRAVEEPPAPLKNEAPRVPANLTDNIGGAPIDPKSYVIGPEDILFIRVWREADLTGGLAVRPDGKITLPLIGDLQAEGLTPERLGA